MPIEHIDDFNEAVAIVEGDATIDLKLRHLEAVIETVGHREATISTLRKLLEETQADRAEAYISVELMEDMPVQIVGVHPVQWRQEWGLPTYGFVRREDSGKNDSLGNRITNVLATTWPEKDIAP